MPTFPPAGTAPFLAFQEHHGNGISSSLAWAVSAVLALLTILGIGYYLLAIWSSFAFRRSLGKRSPAQAFHPPVSILKPVKGIDPGMFESFVSHCRQDYAGQYEIVFGVNSSEDPAVEAIERLQREHPDRSIRLVVCPMRLGTNGKVSNLVQMLGHASYGHVLINDSDIRVSPHYLTRIMVEFAPEEGQLPVGLVTAPYRGHAHGTIGSRMEALGISTEFIAGVLTARKIEGGIHFGLGSTLALSREALTAIGGLEPLVDYLADDFELGARISSSGYRVALANEVVDTSVPAYTFRGFLDHQIRWSRSTRDSRKLGYTGLLFTYGLPWAVFHMVASGLSPFSLWLFSLSLLARVSLALAVGVGVLRDRQVLRDLWLLLPRDIIALFLWAWSFAGNSVAWRGERFALKDGKLQRLTA